MLLVVGGTGDTGNNSEDGAEPIIDAVDCVGNPATTAPVPALTFQNRIEGGFGIRWSGHRIQRASMRFFLQRAGAQEFLDILLARECAIALRGKFALMFFLRHFHSANGDVGSK